MFKHLLMAAAVLFCAAPATAADQEPDPAIWLLSDHDTKIYLLGTVHMLPKDFKWQSPGVERTIREAGELVVESYFDPAKGDAEMMALVGELVLAKPKPILDRVPDSHRRALREAIGRTELPIEFYDMLPTWLAAFTLGSEGILGSYGVDDPDEAPGVEDFLEERFRTDGKPIHSIEDARGVLASMRQMKPSDQVALLVDAISTDEAAGAGEDDAMNRAWVTGAFEELAPEKFGIPPSLFDALLTRRNRAWTTWLIERLERPGTVLVAVGAAHLAGEQSVQRMLSAQGHTAERVD